MSQIREKNKMTDERIVFLFQKLKNKKTNKEVADILGINPSFISNVKAGKAKLSEKIIINMATLAGIEIVKAWEKRCGERIIDQL